MPGAAAAHPQMSRSRQQLLSSIVYRGINRTGA
jgi:hypothetical protein